MADNFAMALQRAGNAFRVSWYSGINWLMSRQARQYAPAPNFTPTKPIPTRDELFEDLRALMRRDAEAVGEGLYPPDIDGELRILDHLQRLHAMYADLPGTAGRRRARDASTASAAAKAANLPEYFTQDFHYQTGGYLTDHSAKLYDIQVDTLFYGATSAMRRTCLRPIAAFMRGRDQRQVSLLDVGCGTGRMLREIRRAYPAMRLSGIDLSRPYLDEARSHMGRLRPAILIEANAEAISCLDESQDIVICQFLFHELPPEVRRTVAGEIARVLKPGGLFVFLDSMQMGDKPGWEGLLEAFPVRFHEPYYSGYAVEDLNALFKDAGLEPFHQELAFLAKLIACRKLLN